MEAATFFNRVRVCGNYLFNGLTTGRSCEHKVQGDPLQHYQCFRSLTEYFNLLLIFFFFWNTWNFLSIFSPALNYSPWNYETRKILQAINHTLKFLKSSYCFPYHEMTVKNVESIVLTRNSAFNVLKRSCLWERKKILRKINIIVNRLHHAAVEW